MKILKLFFTLTVLVSLISGCSDDHVFDSEDTGTVTGNTDNTDTLGPTTQTGRLVADDFYMTVSDPAPEIFTNDLEEPLSSTQTSIAISINANDINDLIQSNASIPVNFRTEWGFFDTDSCNIDESGTCSIQWTSGDPATGPVDCLVSFTAYAAGEEYFLDENDNNTFDEGEVFLDLEEPFLDVNSNGSYTVNMNPPELIDVAEYSRINGIKTGVTNGVHDNADTIYNGSRCDNYSTNPECSGGDTSTIIWTTVTLPIQAIIEWDDDDDPDTDPLLGRDCVAGDGVGPF